MTNAMCQFGNCEKTDTPFVLSITWKGHRQELCRFCCNEHMLAWMQKKCEDGLAAHVERE